MSHQLHTGPQSGSRIGAVVRVALGNFLEMYDFMVFGYYAAAIGRAFFPAQNEYASLMLALMTFGTGYLMRPLGAVLLGAYIDHHGRSEEHTSELQSHSDLVCRLLLEKKKCKYCSEVKLL